MILNKLFLTLLCFSPVTADAVVTEDSLGIPNKIVTSQSIHNDFRKEVYANPAAKFFQHDYSLTSIYFHGIKENASDYRIAPIGKENSSWELKAKSHYILDKNNLVWGEASYEKGSREDVQWNETSDYNLLYPYVMADIHGGDMKYEKYYFDGGYSGRYKNWIFGAEFYYRALNEFRTVDPRPNNVVADLNAKIASGIVIGPYSLSLGLHAGKYKQTNELKYFNELGASKEFHLTGLGNEFVRFSGACNNVFYKGKRFGASIELVPTKQDGFSLSVNYSHFSFDKILSDLNRLALNHVSEYKLIAESAWMGHIDSIQHFGAKIDGGISKRNGYDNLFGDASSNVYPQIGSTLMYNSKSMYGRFSGFYEHTVCRHFPLGISPFVSFNRFESRHTESGNKFDTDNLTIGTLLQGSFVKGRHMVKLLFNTSYRIGMKTKLSVAEDGFCNESLLNTIEHMAVYLNKNEADTRIAIRYQIKIPVKDLSCFLETSWNHKSYFENQHNDTFVISTGISI